MPYVETNLVGGIITPDATPLREPVYLLQENQTAAFQITVVAVAVDGSSAAWQIFGLAKHVDGGGAQLVGAQLVAASPKDVTTNGWLATIDTDADSVAVNLVGDLLQAVNWSVRVDVTVTP